MRVKTMLAVVLAITLPLSAMIVSDNAAGAGNIAGLQGSGTSADPYLISSAEDLCVMSNSYQLHKGAYYRQTSDIVFAGGPQTNRIFIDMSMAGARVIGRVTTNAKAVNSATTATIVVNGAAVNKEYRNGFIEFDFEAGLLTGTNTITAMGTLIGNDFGISASFSGISGNLSLSAPIAGNFKPIGTKALPFNGTYDGNGHSIKGIKVVVSGPGELCAGLFGYTDDAKILDTEIISAPGQESYFLSNAVDHAGYPNSMPPSFTGRSSYTGSIVGHGTPSTSVVLCRNGAAVFSIAEFYRNSAYQETGMAGTHANYYNITVLSFAGGIVGSGAGSIYGCENAGNVMSMLYSNYVYTLIPFAFGAGNRYIWTFDMAMCNLAGGITGYSERTSISVCGNSADVAAITDLGFYLDYDRRIDIVDLLMNEEFVSDAGGIVGAIRCGTISDVYNTGNIRSVYKFNHSTPVWVIDDDIVSTGFDMAAGGIVGVVGGESNALGIVKKAYNEGSVTVTGTAISSTSGLQRIADKVYAGEIAGRMRNTNTSAADCYFARKQAYIPAVGDRAVQATAVERPLSANTFPALDFNKTWRMSADGHPETWPHCQMTIIDASGQYYGVPGYSIDTEHYFDANGTLRGTIDMNGFAITMNKDHAGSKIEIYTLSGGTKTVITKDADGRYRIPMQSVIDGTPVALYIGGLAADPVRSMNIIDTSGMYDWNGKYSLSIPYSFGPDGTLRASVDKKGFEITLKEDYKGSKISLYAMDGSKKVPIEKDGNGRYVIPMQYLLSVPDVTLYIDGLVADPIREMVITDISGTFDGAARYSINKEHTFDSKGTLRSTADKNGFVITLADDYRTSDIEVFTIIGTEKHVLEKRADGTYAIPLELLLVEGGVRLFIDGLIPDPVRSMKMIDTSGMYDGNGKYSLNIGYSFDANGALHASVDKNGFAITLNEDYKGSMIQVYTIDGGKRTYIEKNAAGTYVIPLQYLLNAPSVTLYIDGLVADPIRNMMMIDTSGMYDGNGKYSLNIGHSMDANGVLHASVDKNGFAITLKEDYKGSDIRMYAMDGNKRLYIEKAGGVYVIPLQYLLSVPDVTLYIDGLVADPVRIMTMIDTSGTFDGNIRYSLNILHSFDADGALHAIADRNGFEITLTEDYKTSKISVYAIADGDKMYIEKGGNGIYTVPLQHLLSATEVTLFIDGLIADPVRSMKIVDISGTYDANGKYSLNIGYSFDLNGVLHGTVDKNGFMIMLSKDYAGSDIRVYTMDGGKRTYIEKSGNGIYAMPLEYLIAAPSVTLFIEGFVADPVRNMTIVDTSGTHYGIAKYSVDIAHSFDTKGILHSIVDKNGFTITLSKDFGRSKIELYAVAGGERISIEKDAGGRYVIPMHVLLNASSVTLYIDGLAADPVRDMTMIDTSGTYDANGKYSLNTAYSFDSAGMLRASVDKNGFVITLAEDYRTSKIEIYAIEGGKKITFGKDGGTYVIPLEFLLNVSSVRLYIDGLIADPVRSMVIIDTSGAYGAAKYSIDREHTFDGNGTLHSVIDKNGFTITPAAGYDESKTEIYAMDGDKKIVLTDSGGVYVIPLQYLLGSPSVTLYIDGLAENAMPVKDVPIVQEKMTDLMVVPADEGLGVLAFISIIAFIAFGAGVTILNALRARSILRISAKAEEEDGE